ncbi:beta-N-acetylhexosaminidase [Endozoicomonas arenosclerae]|uniref:beta-N-acetylhexosaminidase n=1 Tax=Endozoicomonas arenosclerae TaxID=1633495 RepID=UPI00078210E4|nr:beta-N-acetylhexosaminidase [Endozoicomonas arenosclerae]
MNTGESRNAMTTNDNNKGVLIIDLEGQSLQPEERDLLQHPGVAGVLFFARNFHDRNQLCDLVSDIRSVRQDLVLMVDQEGGRVQRFKQDFTRLPPAESYVRYFNRDPQRALELIEDCGWLMSEELLSCGLDLSLAPVLDLNLGLTDIVGDRALGTDPETVIKLASAWCSGVHDSGMASVAKHFPGHGSVSEDSHLTLPQDNRTLKMIQKQDMIPFLSLIEQGVEAVMPAHIVFSEVDDQPCGFSSIWLKDILRNKVGFNGLVISDCLTMEGAASAGSYTLRVEKALHAGCDLLLLSNREGVKEVLPWLEQSSFTADSSPLKAKGGRPLDELVAMDRYLSCKDRLDHLAERFS